MPIAGTFEFVIDEETALVGTGQALVVPADRTRVFRAVDGRAQALVAMAAGGTAAVPGSDERIPLPWAR
ncbi:hypothetical protein ACFQ0M_34585 [Kitasatospora aburaviensis]